MRVWKEEHPEVAADEPGPVEWAKYKAARGCQAPPNRRTRARQHGGGVAVPRELIPETFHGITLPWGYDIQ